MIKDGLNGFWMLSVHRKLVNNLSDSFAEVVINRKIHENYYSNKHVNICLTHYLDDILIYTRTKEKQLKYIEIVSAELDRVGLKLNEEKCQFSKINDI